MKQEKWAEIEDAMIHKKYVIDAALKMSKYLFDNGEDELGIHLIRRAAKHDNSKFEDEELDALSRISEDRDSLKDSTEKMTEYKRKAIELHWKNNRHHPEFFSDINNMDEIDIVEMVCDWYARSMQYHTNLIEFCEVRQEDRFHFPEEMYQKIHKYCEIISDPSNDIK